jgi:hypothetical protein
MDELHEIVLRCFVEGASYEDALQRAVAALDDFPGEYPASELREDNRDG